MKKRDLSFDVLKSIAIIFVVFIHTNSFSQSTTEVNFYNIANVLSRQLVNFAVPIFLVISGYFMSFKNFTSIADYSCFLKRQLPRVLLPFLVWSIIYSGYSFYKGEGITKILESFVTFQAVVPFYFILLICQYYLLQPAIRWLGARKVGLFASFVVSILSCLVIQYLRYENNVELPSYLYAGSFTTWIFFPVLGVFISNIDLSKFKFSLFLITLLTLLISTIASFYIIVSDGDVANAVSAVKATSFIYSCSAILFLFSVRKNLWASIFFVKLGEMSFGIYFSHMLIIFVVRIAFNRIANYDLPSDALSSLALTVFVILIGYGTGILLKKINGNLASKYLGF